MKGKKHVVEWHVARLLTDDSVIIGLPGISYDHLFHIDKFDKVSEDIYNDMDERRNKLVPPS